MCFETSLSRARVLGTGGFGGTRGMWISLRGPKRLTVGADAFVVSSPQALREFRSGIRTCERGRQRRARNGRGSLHELQRQRAAGEPDERPQQRERRREMVAEVRSVLDAVTHPVERVGNDLRKGAGIGTVGPKPRSRARERG